MNLDDGHPVDGTAFNVLREELERWTRFKKKRLQEVVSTFRETALESSRANDIGREHVVLVEGHSKRSTEEHVQLTGKNDGFKRCVFSDSFAESSDTSHNTITRQVKPGDFVVVKALDAGVSTLQCEVLRFA